MTLDAYRTTGSSPGLEGPSAAYPSGDLSIHLLGPGRVGCELLQLLQGRPGLRLIAVTDSSGTLHECEGIDPEEVRQLKESGSTVLAGGSGGGPGPLAEALKRANAEVVIDVSATNFERPRWTHDLERHVLDTGKTLILAAKDALSARAPSWVAGRYRSQLHYNAALGGTGAQLRAELEQIRERWRSVGIVGSATTTTIIQALELGRSHEEGLKAARRLGYLEADPELDLRGVDAAVKLSIVAGALTGRSIDPRSIGCPDVRQLSPETLRARRREGATTRLVGRVVADGEITVAYEKVTDEGPLAVSRDRVAYAYELDHGERRIHYGEGLGSKATAEAVWRDLSSVSHRLVDAAPEARS